MHWLGSLTAALVATARADKVTELPGLDVSKLGFDVYSGYVEVSPKRHMFYTFTTSERDPAADPLVIWFTGGPGCSGMDAFFNENGPFVPKSDKTLELRPYRWNSIANVIWIEQPIGVGFSYEEGKEQGYEASDSQAAMDNYNFLRGFLKEFPQFEGRPLWTTGESYGGMYQPTLVEQIVSGPDATLAGMIQGMMLGNPVLICESANLMGPSSHNLQFMRFFYDGLLSWGTYKNWLALGCDADWNQMLPAKQDECTAAYNAARAEVGVINQQLKSEKVHPFEALAAERLTEVPNVSADLDPDDLVYDFCTGNGTVDVDYATPAEQCVTVGGKSSALLNDAEFQKKIHAKPPVGGTWSVCAGPPQLNYNGDLQGSGLIPVLKRLFRAKPSLRILYYSGDFDVATVPMQVTQACLAELDTERGTQSVTWKPWRVGGRHAGYWEQFDRYAFASVKAAGHEVPTFQPLISYNMYQRWLEHGDLDEDYHAGAVAAAREPRQGAMLNAMKEAQQEARTARAREVVV